MNFIHSEPYKHLTQNTLSAYFGMHPALLGVHALSGNSHPKEAKMPDIEARAIQCHNRNMRRSLPTGACQHKSGKTGRWIVKKPRKGKAAAFSMTRSCSGDLAEVMALAVKLARDAKAEGNIEYAQKILKRAKRIPMEYEREKLLKEQKRLVARLQKAVNG